jgi:hypothetical protein
VISYCGSTIIRETGTFVKLHERLLHGGKGKLRDVDDLHLQTWESDFIAISDQLRKKFYTFFRYLRRQFLF